jgi:3-oxoacyl-[acyl-carrier-protein] synthase-3
MHKMHMAGGEVFKFATRVIGESINQAVNMAGITLDDVALIVPHQANERIIHAAARGLRLEQNLFMTNVDRYGNTSAASIPIALYEAVEQGRIKEGDYVVFVGFGGGLTWAAMVVKWGHPKPRDGQASRFNRQRRNFAYTLAHWRARMRRWSRWFNDGINRIRPERGRVSRLRHKIDRADLD